MSKNRQGISKTGTKKKQLPGSIPAPPLERSADPVKVWKEFVGEYSLTEAHKLLYEWLMLAITKSPSIYDSAHERKILLEYYQRSQQLIDAVFTIGKEHTKRA